MSKFKTVLPQNLNYVFGTAALTVLYSGFLFAGSQVMMTFV